MGEEVVLTTYPNTNMRLELSVRRVHREDVFQRVVGTQ